MNKLYEIEISERIRPFMQSGRSLKAGLILSLRIRTRSHAFFFVCVCVSFGASFIHLGHFPSSTCILLPLKSARQSLRNKDR